MGMINIDDLKSDSEDTSMDYKPDEVVDVDTSEFEGFVHIGPSDDKKSIIILDSNGAVFDKDKLIDSVRKYLTDPRLDVNTRVKILKAFSLPTDIFKDSDANDIVEATSRVANLLDVSYNSAPSEPNIQDLRLVPSDDQLDGNIGDDELEGDVEV